MKQEEGKLQHVQVIHFEQLQDPLIKVEQQNYLNSIEKIKFLTIMYRLFKISIGYLFLNIG